MTAMPYYLDRWDYICPNGHRNTIDKSYLATEPSDSAVAFSASFPSKLPCGGCQYKLILPTADSVLHCNISEFDYERTKENKLAESAAYHEAAHSVIAAVQKLRIDRRGLRIDQRGSGISYFKFAKPEGRVNLGPEVERERTIRSTQAGFIAQERFFKRFYAALGRAGSSSDADGIRALLEEMYGTRDECQTAEAKLLAETEKLVDANWNAIEALGQTLLSKQWEPQAPPSGERRWASQTAQKRMTGTEVVELLRQFLIEAELSPDR
jgi:hypothetical protein